MKKLKLFCFGKGMAGTYIILSIHTSFLIRMSCSSSSIKCSFASERISKLESAALLYANMRSATIEAGRSGKLDHRVVSDDLAMIDKKLFETAVKIRGLKPCFTKV